MVHELDQQSLREKLARQTAMNETIGEAIDINNKAKGFLDWLFAIDVVGDDHL
jgi:hypothetical protein